jgi:hypothetical protein
MPDTLLDLAAAVDDAFEAASVALAKATRSQRAGMADVCCRLEVACATLADALAPVAGAVAAEKRAWDEAQRGGGAVPY